MEFKNREILENNFVFCLWKNPKIYSKYVKKIDELKSFFEKDTSKFFFTIGRKIVDSGMLSLDHATVLTYLQSNSIIKDQFNSYGGYEIYNIISKTLDEKNVDGYFNEIIKMNVINELEVKGFNIEKDWAKISQMSVEEIRAYYSFQLNDIFLKTGSEAKVENFEITDEDFEFFNSGKQMGLSIASTSPLLNYEILGLNRGLSFVGGHVNQGKAQPLTAKILTPRGFKLLGKIKKGDVVCGYDIERGHGASYKKQKVTGVFPQGKKRVWQPYFSDGSSTKCCIEHLWTLRDEKDNLITNTLGWFKEQQEQGKKFYMLERRTYNPESEYAYKAMYDLFAIGYMFGSKCNVNSGYIEFEDKDQQKNFFQSMQRNIENLDHVQDDNTEYNRLYWIEFSKELKEWYNGISKIPFMQTDVYINTRTKKQYVVFGYHMINKLSLDDRRALLHGWLTSSSFRTIDIYNSKVRTENVPMLDFMVELGRSCGWQVFRTSARVAYFNAPRHIYKKVQLMQIVDCGYEEEMICISVSGKDQLYITDDFLITHNTSFSMAVIVKAWLNAKIKCCIISNEQTINEFKQLLIAMVGYELFGDDNTLDRRRLKTGKFTKEEQSMFKQIANKINTDYVPYIKFAKIFNYSIEDVQMIIETLSAQGYGGFIYDVFKADDSASNRVIGEMKEMSKELFMSADKNNASIVATVQLGLSDLNVRYLGLDNISTSKHITEPATEVLLLRPMWEDEVTGGKHDIKIETPTFDVHGMAMKDRNGKTIMKSVPVMNDEYRKIKLLFLAKTRNTGHGVVIAYKFDGGTNQWKELGYCYPSHENRGNKK